MLSKKKNEVRLLKKAEAITGVIAVSLLIVASLFAEGETSIGSTLVIASAITALPCAIIGKIERLKSEELQKLERRYSLERVTLPK